ncbi:MAG: hypothetical protein KAX65_00025 [Caldilineaceae bacterium]|nr:hypothetical protein [Caldilineaceae bacterium]
MKLYIPTAAETGAAIRLLLARFPTDAPRVGRGIDLIPKLTYTTAADRNGMWQQLGIEIFVNADPGWTIPSTPDERRNTDAEDSTPREYTITPGPGAGQCQCWDHVITGGNCRHVYAVMAYKAIINSKLDAMAQRGALDLRPAGRYEGLFDLVDCWGMTICGAVYLPKLDRWRAETDRDVASFANWLTRDEAMAEIQRPRAQEEYA